MKCPKCSAVMETFSFKEIAIERCTECQGLWFQPGELESLRRDAWMADYVIDQGSAKKGKQLNVMQEVKCPECGVEMDKVADDEQSHVIYEVCPQGHGTFLDAGEFSDLVHKTFWDKFKRASKKAK